MNEFPHEIDLGKAPPTDSLAAPSEGAKSAKDKKYYPTLYISGIEGIEDLPKEGEALIYFRRRRISHEEDSKGAETSSAELEVTKLCLPEKPEVGAEEDLGNALKKTAKEEGLEIDGDDSGDSPIDDEESE